MLFLNNLIRFFMRLPKIVERKECKFSNMRGHANTDHTKELVGLFKYRDEKKGCVHVRSVNYGPSFRLYEAGDEKTNKYLHNRTATMRMWPHRKTAPYVYRVVTESGSVFYTLHNKRFAVEEHSGDRNSQ